MNHAARLNRLEERMGLSGFGSKAPLGTVQVVSGKQTDEEITQAVQDKCREAGTPYDPDRMVIIIRGIKEVLAEGLVPADLPLSIELKLSERPI